MASRTNVTQLHKQVASATESQTQHNLGDRRGMDAAIAGGYGRYGRMFPEIGIEYDEHALAQLAETMIKQDDGQFFNTADDDENALIPAGYTYFGQFVDHDITLDLTSIFRILPSIVGFSGWYPMT